MSKIPPKGSQYGNYKRADYFEARVAVLEALLREAAVQCSYIGNGPGTVYDRIHKELP
jgi:hypothetical protein